MKSKLLLFLSAIAFFACEKEYEPNTNSGANSGNKLPLITSNGGTDLNCDVAPETLDGSTVQYADKFYDSGSGYFYFQATNGSIEIYVTLNPENSNIAGTYQTTNSSSPAPGECYIQLLDYTMNGESCQSKSDYQISIQQNNTGQSTVEFCDLYLVGDLGGSRIIDGNFELN